MTQGVISLYLELAMGGVDLIIIGGFPVASQGLPYAEALDLGIPIILVGGNREVERLEAIVRGGRVDFVAFSRPLVREPDLPLRWLEGRGKSRTDCISCNACLYAMFVHPGRDMPGEVLSLLNQGSQDRIRESYSTLLERACHHALISEEFMREVYPDSDNPEGNETGS